MPGVPRDTRRRIGLLGGSFNPAHQGHRHVSLEALKRLGLDEATLVYPGKAERRHLDVARRRVTVVGLPAPGEEDATVPWLGPGEQEAFDVAAAS